MTRAEQAALKAYPYDEGMRGIIYEGLRPAFIKGYEQAEKDIISLIESRILEILGDAQPNPMLRIELQSIIDKIK